MSDKENRSENANAASDVAVADPSSTESTKEQQLSNNNTPTSTKQLPFDPTIQHPLLHSWTLWYDAQLSAGKRPSQWGDQIKKVYEVATVEDFWRLYNNISLPSQLQIGCSYNLFKAGIEPKWEDAANAKGGKWTIIIQKTKGLLDRLWLWMLLGCIGEMLGDDEDQLCGAVVNIRKGQDKLCIWTKDEQNKDAIMKIGLAMKKVLELPDQFPVGYTGHFQKSRNNKYEL